MSEDKVVARLKRIEGQVRGVIKMIEDDREHEDVLIQLSAIKSAVNGVANLILEEHLHECVVDGIKNGDEEATISDLMTALSSYFKMN